EEAIPSPYSFNIKTGAAYGTKVIREEVGDAEGRVKGTYTVSSPRGATRVVQYHADDTGFHANIKTSEPNIKTHSPSNAQIEAIPVKGGSASGVKTVQVPDGKIHRTAELPQVATVPVAQYPVIQATDAADPARIKNIKTIKTIKSVVASGFNIKDSQLREPTARRVVKEPVVAAIKSAPVLVPQQNIKTVVKKSDPSKIRLTQQRFSPLDIPVIAKGGSDVLAEGIQAAPFTDGAKEIIVYEDGTTVELQGSNILGQDLSTFTGQDSFGNRNPQVSYSQRERGGSATIFRAGSIDEKVKPVQAAPKAPTSTQIFSNPQRTAGTLSQLGISSDIVNLNRQLQRQSEEELKRTLAGIVDVDTNLQSASLSDKELADIARRIGSGAMAAVAPAPQLRRPDQVQSIKPAVSPQRIPLAPRPQVVGAGIDQKFKYTAGRVTAEGIQGGTRRVNAGQIRGSSALGQGENVFILGNAPGAMGTLRTGSQGIPKPKPKVSPQALPKPQMTATQALPQPGIGADIAELNRQLQMQSEEELKRTLAGIVNVDANIQGASLSEKELADISRRIGSGVPAPVVPVPQQRRPDQIQRIKPQRVPVAPRTQFVRTGIDQKFKYTAGRVTSGRIQGGRVTAGQIRGSSAVGQGENVFILGNAPGLPQPGIGADIAELNRQLQMQSEEELKRTLAGIVNVDANIQGASLSEKELADISRRIGSGAPAPVAPVPQQRRPDQIQRVKPQRVPVAPRPQVVGTGIDQKFKYTAGRVTSGRIQGGIRRVTAGQIRGSSAVGQGGNVFILGNSPEKELADISRRIGSGAPAPQQRRPDQIQRIKPQRVLVAPRPQVVGAGIDQKFKYTAGRVSSGGIQGGIRRVTAGQIRGSSAVGQGENVFILGNAPGAIGTLRTGSQGIPKPNQRFHLKHYQNHKLQPLKFYHSQV
ncbi:ATP-grasp domain-containing protein, partial [Trichonephila clavata]